MIDADLEASRPDWVKPVSFWEELGDMLTANPELPAPDDAIGDHARALVALHRSDAEYRAVLDRVANASYAELHATATYSQVGLDAGNGWRRQPGAGVWGSDWYGRALASVVYIFVNDFHEALYLTRGTDDAGRPLHGRHGYTMTFEEGTLPPVDRARGGFWSLTMYDQDIFMLADPPGGRVNLGTVDLDAGDLSFDGATLTLHLGYDEPEGAAARANWLPAPNGPFCLAFRAYVPEQPLVESAYRLPNLIRASGERAGGFTPAG